MPLYTGENKQPPRDYTPNPNDIVSRNLAADARGDRIMGSAAAAWGAKRVADQWVRTSPTYDPSRGVSQIFDKPIADLKDAVTAYRKGTAAQNNNFTPNPYRGMAPNNYPQIAPPAASKAVIPATQRIVNDPHGMRSNANFSTKNRLKSTWKGVAGSLTNKLLALYVPYKFYKAHKTDELRNRYLNKEMTLQEVNNMRYERGITGRSKTAGTVDTFKGVSGRPGVQGVPSIKNPTSSAPKIKTAAQGEDLAVVTLNDRDLAAKGAVGAGIVSAGSLLGAADQEYDLRMAKKKRRGTVLHARRVNRDLRANKRESDALWGFIDELRTENLNKRLNLDVHRPDFEEAYDALDQERERISAFEKAKRRELNNKESVLSSLKYKLNTERKNLRETLREAPKLRNKALTAAGIGGAAALGLGAYALRNDTQD